MKTIRYNRLDPQGREIRLLEIEPASNLGDPVRCRLITVRFSADLDYIGLSSLYGDASESDSILVNGYPITITAHLASALRHVRAVFYPAISKRFQRTPARPQSGTPRWLRKLFGMSREDFAKPGLLRVWLDYLCVNQHDELEKGRQLTLVKQAYQSAELVVGWLGEKGEHHDITMATLAEIEDSMPATWGDPGDKERHPENYAPEHRWAKAMSHMWIDGPNGELPFLLPHWIGFHDFMNRQFFQRRWILEEIAMAKFPAFLIGDVIITWKQVLRVNRLLEEFKYERSHTFPPHLQSQVAELPLETVCKLLDEFAKKEAMGANVELEKTLTTTTSSTKSGSGSSR